MIIHIKLNGLCISLTLRELGFNSDPNMRLVIEVQDS